MSEPPLPHSIAPMRTNDPAWRHAHPAPSTAFLAASIEPTVAHSAAVALPFELQAVHAPKEGNTAAQYEDAFAHTWDGTRLTVAVADGASAAIYAREWAGMLVATFAQEPPLLDAQERIAGLAEVWRHDAERGGDNAHASSPARERPWYALEKLPAGSAATLTVLQIDVRTMRWKTWSVGDTCLFVVRENRLIYAVPKKHSREFDDRPALIETKQRAADTKLEWTESSAEFRSADILFLMTDAAAAWFFREFEQQRAPWNEIPLTDAALEAWLKGKRDKAQMRNDDVTILRIQQMP